MQLTNFFNSITQSNSGYSPKCAGVRFINVGPNPVAINEFILYAGHELDLSNRGLKVVDATVYKIEFFGLDTANNNLLAIEQRIQ